VVRWLAPFDFVGFDRMGWLGLGVIIGP
jgi:hypothetical protein